MGKLLSLWRKVGRFANRDDHAKWAEQVSETADQLRQTVANIISGVIDVESLQLPEQALPPPAAPNVGSIFTMDVGGVTEFFFEDSNGNVIQLTTNGQISTGPTTQAAVAGNTATIAGSGISSTGGFAYLTQFTWYVNATTGNDANDGATPATAIQTLPELARRLQGKYALASVTINLTGQFTSPLTLEFLGSPGVTCTVNGAAPTQIDAGSLTGAYQAYSPAANTDARVTDAAQAWGPNVNARIRFTSGAANGNIAWVLADLGANTARIGQLVNRTTGNVSPNPGIGDTYVVETLPTLIAGYMVALSGGMKFAGKDLTCHVESVDNINQYIRTSGQTALTTDQAPTCRLDGCKFENAVITAGTRQAFYESFFGMIGTHAVCAMGLTLSRVLANGHSFTQSILINAGARLEAQVHLIGQGAGISLGTGATLQLTVDGAAVAAGLGVYSAAGTACLDVGVGACVGSALAGNTLFGTGNTSTESCRVRSGGGFHYLTTPTITGPATDCLVGGTAFTWAAIAGSPQASVMNANNGARAGALL